MNDQHPSISRVTILRERIRNDIMFGRLLPGEKLKIEKMQERYQTGATPLREALTLLVSFGLVEKLEQRGFRVADISVEELDDMLRTRSFLEDRALRDSIAEGKEDWVRTVRSAIENLEFASLMDPSRQGVMAAWETHHRNFHEALISACTMQSLLRFCSQLFDANHRYRYLGGLTPCNPMESCRLHKNIADAALDRDADRASELLKAHYDWIGRQMRRAVEGSAVSY